MFTKYLDRIPTVTRLPEYDIGLKDGGRIEALMYDGVECKGKKTAVFAYLGIPEAKKGEKLPAVLLVHGGGGVAYSEWVRLWNERGFAALALCLRGHFPLEGAKGVLVTETQEDLFERFTDTDEYAAHPEGYCIYDESTERADTWLYQCVANTILAHNILCADSRIDPARVGITGISWGGVITSQVIAYDRRFAFAIPIYGSACLQYSQSFVGEPFTKSPAKELWEVSDRYADIPFPVLWLCSNYDTCFDIYPNSLCYLQTRGSGSVFSAVDGLIHSHVDGWSAPESYRFAESAVCGRAPLIHTLTEPCGRAETTLELSGEGEELSATLFYLTEPMHYTSDSSPDFKWKTAPCRVCKSRVSFTPPDGATCYYLSLVERRDGHEYTTTSSLVIL